MREAAARGALSARLIGMLAFLLWASGSAAARAPTPAKVVGPGKCAECHSLETQTWKRTHHAKSFRSLPRTDSARRIAKAMGFRRMRSGSLCLGCHFTSRASGSRNRPIAGVSCESCHGAAKGWVARHSQFSGRSKRTESAAQRRKRWADAEAAGMVRPSRVYRLVKNCFSCHIVPEERLVDRGHHPAGSPFEIVSWSQGEVRHNTWYNNGRENRADSRNRKRLLYAVGTAVELETSLRALGRATRRGRYAATMATRAQIAKLRMKRLARATRAPEMIAIVNAANRARLMLGNAKEINAAANAVARGARRLAARHDGSKLAAIDRYIPGPAKYRGRVSKPRGR